MKTYFILFLFFFFGCSSNSKTEYKIVYNVGYDIEADDYEIFIMDMDGSNKKNISNWKGVDWVYHAHKNKIFFISDRDTTHRFYYLYEMDINGQNVRKISKFRLRDSWLDSRKNGQELIVSPHKSVDSVFYLIDLDGKILQKVSTGLPYNSDPCFSPDGKQIVFRGATKKSKREKGFIDELYLINDEGKALKQLTHYPPNDTTAEWYAYKAGTPRWNSKENFISYQSKQNGSYKLFAVTPDGKKQWLLTSSDKEEGWHDWSSDGQWLAVEIFDAGQSQFDIALIDWQTKNMKILTDTTYKYQQAPVFVEIPNK
ncbi:MAG: hypothetical protein D8M58_13705 [Calditrichaeota bacterium]|nr:MAG: hypothetical protein DWQ03_14945 [Calditrichota bacterium]MBL1206455.1 hypothetical protein [Calditrichota bacterium]NOG46282.1 hypothetical protein [Calditrichota bacterium]